MGSLVWNGNTGNWNDPANWIVITGTDSVPEAGDTVTISAPGSYVITVSDAEAVDNLTLTNPDAELDIAGTLAVGGTLSNQAALMAVLTGGTLAGGTVVVSGGATLTSTDATLLATTVLDVDGDGTVDNGTLNDITWQGSLLVTGTTDVVGGFNLQNGSLGLVALDLTAGQLHFLDTESLDNATVNYLGLLPIGTEDPSSVPITAAPGFVVTLGTNVVMSSSGAADGTIDVPGTLFNEGTLEDPGFPGSLLIDGSFQNDGSLHITSSIEVAGNLVNNGFIGPLTFLSTLRVDGNVLGDGTISMTSARFLLAGTLVVNGAIEGNDVIIGPFGAKFTVTAATIEPGVTIDNFSHGSTIDLTGTPFIDGTTAVTYVDGLVTVTEGTTIEDLFELPGLKNNAPFTVQSDGAAIPGTDVVTGAQPCFVSGTRIRTERGEVPVEQLRVGDLVPVVRAGGMLPIIWIGRRTVRIDRHPRPSEVRPVRVAAGAFADFVPARDLWLSPEHAVFLHGVLVPVRHLLNGSTVAQVPLAEVTYWHVELPSHDLLLCEGAWTESYLDMGNRAAFENADAPISLHPDFSRESWEARACQQQERGGPVLEAIRRAINARAAARQQAA